MLKIRFNLFFTLLMISVLCVACGSEKNNDEIVFNEDNMKSISEDKKQEIEESFELGINVGDKNVIYYDELSRENYAPLYYSDSEYLNVHGVTIKTDEFKNGSILDFLVKFNQEMPLIAIENSNSHDGSSSSENWKTKLNKKEYLEILKDINEKSFLDLALYFRNSKTYTTVKISIDSNNGVIVKKALSVEVPKNKHDTYMYFPKKDCYVILDDSDKYEEIYYVYGCYEEIQSVGDEGYNEYKLIDAEFKFGEKVITAYESGMLGDRIYIWNGEKTENRITKPEIDDKVAAFIYAEPSLIINTSEYENNLDSVYGYVKSNYIADGINNMEKGECGDNFYYMSYIGNSNFLNNNTPIYEVVLVERKMSDNEIRDIYDIKFVMDSNGEYLSEKNYNVITNALSQVTGYSFLSYSEFSNKMEKLK